MFGSQTVTNKELSFNENNFLRSLNNTSKVESKKLFTRKTRRKILLEVITNSC